MLRPCLAAFAAAALVPLAAAQPPGWATLKGQVVFPANVPIPARAPLAVTQDKANCLRDGPILDEVLIVNAKSRGVKNVVVWLRPNDPNPKAKLDAKDIHPADAQRKPAHVVMDQPCCMFTPRVTLARVGDTLEMKNSDRVAHNFFWTSANNGEFNPVIPAGGTFKLPNPLVGESGPIGYKCTIHPWMGGVVRVFDHPYFAVTDDDGRFTLPNAPVGNYRLVVWHEKTGFFGGAAGRTGVPVVIVGPTTELPATPFP